MTDVASELAVLVERFGSWRVEYQDHPAAWIAVRRPAANQVHVLAAYDLAGLWEKLVCAESLSTVLAELRSEFAGWGIRFGAVWASAAPDPGARRLYASRGTALWTAWTPAELRAKLSAELDGE